MSHTISLPPNKFDLKVWKRRKDPRALFSNRKPSSEMSAPGEWTLSTTSLQSNSNGTLS